MLSRFESSYLSNGILNRIKAIFEAKHHGSDINHITGDVHFLAFGLPRKTTLLTIHDCGFLEGSLTLKRQLLKWIWLDLPVHHCRYITAVSQSTKADIIRLTGCPENKVIVIPTTVPKVLTYRPAPFHTDCPRFLHIGLAPNKNLARHAEALSGIHCHLHIIGRMCEKDHQILQKQGIDYSHALNISTAELQAAYATCDALLFASTLEGFGMPIVEAQTVGRPVITSNISSMPEVAGPRGAVFVDPYDVSSIRKGIKQVIDDEALRRSLIETGFENIKRFDAETIARQYEALYTCLIRNQK